MRHEWLCTSDSSSTPLHSNWMNNTRLRWCWSTEIMYHSAIAFLSTCIVPEDRHKLATVYWSAGTLSCYCSVECYVIPCIRRWWRYQLHGSASPSRTYSSIYRPSCCRVAVYIFVKHIIYCFSTVCETRKICLVCTYMVVATRRANLADTLFILQIVIAGKGIFHIG